VAEAIREALRTTPSGLRNAEIVQRLGSMGFGPGEKLRRNVNSELWRQKKRGTVKKAGKRFVLVVPRGEASGVSG
jgi:Fe2+ transport system protein FeoA